MADYYLGCDVSKGYADFVLLDQQLKTMLKPFRLDDTIKGHGVLEQTLLSFCAQNTGTTIYAAVESTGGLENNWLLKLERLAKEVPLYAARVNPKGVAQYTKAALTRTVTDAVSAQMIAEYICVHRQKIRFGNSDSTLSNLRPMWTSLCLLKKQRNQLSNSLNSLLYSALPSILIYCRHGFPQWVLLVLKTYSTAQLLAKASKKRLTAIPFILEERATKLIAAAKTDIASRVDDSNAFLIQTLVNQIIALDATIESLGKQMIIHAAHDPHVQLLCTFPGIAELSAVGLLINMPQQALLPDAKHLASFWGLHPVFRDSGDGHSLPHMSKFGRSQPRAILFTVAMSSVVHNPLIRALYQRHIKQGKPRMAALGICMHKIARIVYGMLNSNKAFDQNIDLKNQEKKPQSDQKTIEVTSSNRLRRYQSPDESAPISKRENKKRERLNGSQNAVSIENGISVKSPSKI